MNVHGKFSSIRIVRSAALVLALVLAAPPSVASDKRGNAIQKIDIVEKASRTEITVVARSRPTFTVFKLSKPMRLFIDIVDADLSKIAPRLKVRNGVVGDITVVTSVPGSAPMGRIELAFDRDASYDIETRGSKLVIMIDGAGRERPDLRLAAVRQEAARLERAVKRERKLLAQLQSARRTEEKLKRNTQTERAHQEILTRRVAAARQQAERLSLQARTELDRITAELESLGRKKKLAGDKMQALARAVKAEKERRGMASAERKKAEQLRRAIRRAVDTDRSRLAAVRAATRRAEAEKKAALAATKAVEEHRDAAERVAQAKTRGHNKALRRLQRQLDERARALKRAQSALTERRRSVEEARLAEAQASARLRAAQKRRTSLEAEKRELGDRRLAKERARVKALRQALARKIKLQASAANERAQRDLTQLEDRLFEQRRAVKAAKQKAEVEQARIAMLQSQLGSERAALKRLKALRRSEEQRVAQLAKEARRYAAEAEAARKRAATYAKQLEREQSKTSKKAARVADAEINKLKQRLRRERKLAADALERAKRADSERQQAEARRRASDAKRKSAEAKRQSADAKRRAAESDRLAAVAQREAAEEDARAAETKRRAAEAKRRAAETARDKAEAKARTAEAVARDAARTAPQPEVSKRSEIRDVAFREIKGAGGEVTIKLDGKTPYEIIRHNKRRIELRLSASTLPKALERSLDASEFDGPIKLISSFASRSEPGVIRVVIDLREDATDAIKTVGTDIVWAFAKRIEPALAARAVAKATPPPRGKASRNGRRMPPGVRGYPGAVGAEGGSTAKGGGSRFLGDRRAKRPGRRYSGKRINVTIKDADIRNVLTFLAKEGGVNIVASDKVSGSVTFHLENVPWDLALDMILKTQGYDYVLEAGVYRVAPAEDIRAEFEAEVKKKEALRDLKPLVVRFISVNYANLKELEKHIKGVLSKHGTVTIDGATSTILVKDIEEHVQASEEIVRRLDVQIPQVLIEARIVEASTSFSSEFGIQWGGDFAMAPAFGNPTGLAFPSIIGLSGGADDSAAPTEGLLTSNPNFAVNLPAAVGAGAGGALGLTLGSIGGSANLNLRLSAAESRGQVKIVSAPKILTLDGNKAVIEQGISIPVPVVSANGVNTQFFDASLKLDVTTNTSPDGNIRLDVDINKDEPDFGQTSANGAPTIQKKHAKTALLVRDGETTVIGGIFTRNTGFNESGVPVLSKIPILGWFFKNHRESDSRSELLIFITPRVLNRRASVVGQGQFETNTRVDN